MVIIFWLVMALLVAWIASTKGRSMVGWFLYGLVIWPIALIHIAVASNNARKCPKCYSTVDARASVCKHCRHKFTEAEVTKVVEEKKKSRNTKFIVLVVIALLFVALPTYLAQEGVKYAEKHIHDPIPTPTVSVQDQKWIDDAAQRYYDSHISMRWSGTQFYGGQLTLDTSKKLMAQCLDTYDKDHCEEVIDKKFWIGMDKNWATMSVGNPNKINTTVVSGLTQEQWVYGDPIYQATYLYFYNDELKSYQN